MTSVGALRSGLAGLAGLVVSTACLVLAGAGPATGSVIDADHRVDKGVETLENFCGSGIDFRHKFNYRVYSSVKAHGPNAPIYFSDRFHGFETFTNLDTEKTVTLANNGHFRDQRITVNDDGTLTIVQQFSGIQIVRDDSGRIILKDRGTMRFEIIVDYNGTLRNADDDVLIEDRGEVFRGGKFDTVNRDFCADMLEFTA